MNETSLFCCGRAMAICIIAFVFLLVSVVAFPGPDDIVFIDGFESGAGCIWSDVETVEICDFIDNDCNGTIDDGEFGDVFEPNGSCGTFTGLQGPGSNQTLLFYPTLYPAGDEDFFRFIAQETDSECGCCDPPFCFDEDYQLLVDLAVPFGTGSFELCIGLGSCDFPAGSCTTISSGQQDALSVILAGSCSGDPDSYEVFVRVRAVSSPGFSCTPYTLTYSFISGVCG